MPDGFVELARKKLSGIFCMNGRDHSILISKTESCAGIDRCI